MTEKKPGLEVLPDALNRERPVTLSTGETVTVQKWSIAKARALTQMAGDDSKLAYLAEQSVIESDRGKLKELQEEDLLTVATAAVELNAGLLKKLLALTRALESALVESAKESK